MKKRIALAAAAALAGGLLVAAPASAVTASSFGADTTAIAGPANYVNVVVTEGGYASAFVTVTGGALYDGTTTKIVNNDTTTTLKVATPVNGTITLNVFDETSAGVYSATAADSLVITVGPAPVVVSESYNHSTVSAFSTDVANTYADAAGVLYAPKGTLNAPESVTAFTVKQYSYVSTDDTLSTTAVTKAVTVSLSGVGVLADASNPNATYLAYSAGAANTQKISVKNDGRSGVATITIAVDGKVVATKTVTFYGTVAKYTASVDHNQVRAADTLILTVKSYDAAGILIPTVTYTITDNDTITTPSLQGDTVVGVETYTVGATAETLGNLVIGNGAAETATVAAHFVANTLGTVVVTADKASYAPGEKATFSVVAKDADGEVAGDYAYSIAFGGSTALYGAPTPTITLVDGKASFTGYMPVAQGPVILTVTVGTAAAATLNLSVVDPAATAQAAAITALQTSVATLTTTVASLVASMTAQIKVINATMLKIQKALAALSKKVK